MNKKINVKSYAAVALPHLESIISRNEATMRKLASRLVRDVKNGKSLFGFGSGHSALFPLELFHRAGGASFVIPVVADFLMPSAGPSVVRVLERTEGFAPALLERYEPKRGEMIWICSQSGINSSVVDMALAAKKLGLYTVGFTSLVHSRASKSRHSSRKRLFEVCDQVLDLGGEVGDAALAINDRVRAGPLSTLGAVMLGHSIIVAACATLENQGTRCVYTSVNTPDGEARNRALEIRAKKRDFLLR